MICKTLCFASAKGGSGKTVVAASLAKLLGALGRKVVLIDADAATNGLTLFNLQEVRKWGEISISQGNEPLGIFEWDRDGPPPGIMRLDSNVFFLPATFAFQNTENTLPDRFRMSLTSAVQIMREEYEFIIIDAQAGSDVFACVAMSREVSDEVVIVAEYDPVSAAGVERLKGLLRNDLTYDRTWVLLNKMLPDFAKSYGDFLEVAKYLPPLPWDSDVIMAYARRKLAINLEEVNEYTIGFLRMAETLLGDEVKSSFEKWKTKLESQLRRPLLIRQHELEAKLDALVHLRADLENSGRAKRRRAVLSLYVFATAIMTSLIWAVTFTSPDYRAWPAWILFVIGIVSLVLFSVAHTMWTRVSRTADLEVERARLRRQERYLEDKLKTVQSLVSADFDEIVKGSGRTS
ncbi:MAG: ParA family protein [Armatimonadetes bacterium]|nr:ParA family protein [Armatimonadota bacterium]